MTRTCHQLAAVALLIVTVAACDLLPSGPVSDTTRDVTILYTNDFESAYDPIPAFWRDDLGHVGGITQLATLIEQCRSERELTFLLDAGDIFTGTLAKLTRSELPFELMISMDYDAMCIGNHEFEYGWWVLRDAMQRAPFPVLAAYRKRFAAVGEVIGHTAKRLTRRYNEESTLGNLFADILRKHGDTDVAFVHSGGLRADLPEGEITREDLLDAFPFTDVVTTLRMTGSQILEVLEQSFTLARGVLQVSGMTVAYDPEQPIGQRVVSVSINGTPLRRDTSYTVTTFDFLASGADLYRGFLDAEVLEAEGPEFAELLEQHFARVEPVPTPEGGRLVRIRSSIGGS